MFVSKIYGDSNALLTSASVAGWLITIVLPLKMINFTLNSFIKGKNKFRIPLRTITFILELICIILLAELYLDTGDNLIRNLTEVDCSGDPILNANLVHIDSFKAGVAKKTSTCLAFLGWIIIIEIGIIIYRVCNDCLSDYNSNKY